jgi:hypothetical protein
MIKDAIKSRLEASPFRPFVLKMGSGHQFPVRHRDFVSISPGGRHLILWVDDDRYVDIDVLLIESIEQGGNGHRRRSA